MLFVFQCIDDIQKVWSNVQKHTVHLPAAILSGKSKVSGRKCVAIFDVETMVKSCCVIGCIKRATNGSGVSFYRFPVDVDRRNNWIAAVNRKN